MLHPFYDLTFVASRSYNGSLFNCPYSNPSRLSLEDSDGTDKNLSFSHEPDLYGLAETVHMLLFGGRPMEVTRDRQGRFFPTAFISNFQPSKVLFERLFLLLLNPKVGVGVEEGKWEELKSCVDCLRRTVEKRCKDGKWEEVSGMRPMCHFNFCTVLTSRSTS